MNCVIENLKELRTMIDDLYDSMGSKSKSLSDQYLKCDEKINLIMGLYMSEQVKKGEENASDM